MLNYFLSYNNLLYLGHINSCLGLTPAFPTDSTFHEWELYVNILIILNTNTENKPCGAPFPHSRYPVKISKNSVSLQLRYNGPVRAICNSWRTILEHKIGSSLSYSFSLDLPKYILATCSCLWRNMHVPCRLCNSASQQFKNFTLQA